MTFIAAWMREHGEGHKGQSAHDRLQKQGKFTSFPQLPMGTPVPMDTQGRAANFARRLLHIDFAAAKRSYRSNVRFRAIST